MPAHETVRAGECALHKVVGREQAVTVTGQRTGRHEPCTFVSACSLPGDDHRWLTASSRCCACVCMLTCVLSAAGAAERDQHAPRLYGRLLLFRRLPRHHNTSLLRA